MCKFTIAIITFSSVKSEFCRINDPSEYLSQIDSVESFPYFVYGFHLFFYDFRNKPYRKRSKSISFQILKLFTFYSILKQIWREGN
jgi:hypothetical protein